MDRETLWVGIAWTYGQGTAWESLDGPKGAWHLYRFPSRAARDAWVGDGPQIVSDPGYRESPSTLTGWFRTYYNREIRAHKAEPGGFGPGTIPAWEG